MELAWVLVLVGILLPLLVGASFLLGRHLARRQAADPLSPVTRQHIDLFQGGQLSEAAVESAKTRLQNLLERGQVEAAEASLRPGTQYVVQVRALAEIGTDEAGRILERQLQRRLSEDQVEQSWYWIDVAGGLRSLNREQSLPHLLRCGEKASDSPLGHFYAAETVCFVGFPGYLSQFDTALGGAALRLLHRALEGLRCGLQPHVFAEARLGEAVEHLWDHRPERVHPLVVRVFVEALRLLRRAPHAERALGDERPEQEAFGWQMSRLAALEPVLEDYLGEAPAALCAALAAAPAAEQRQALLALGELRADAAAAVLPLLRQPRFAHAELATEVLAFARDPKVSGFLRDWAARRVAMDRRPLKRPRALPPRAGSVPADVPYRAILRALRGHASPQTESFLLLAVQDWDPTYRLAAVSSLGWWEPFDQAEVRRCLQRARKDPSPDVRQTAQAALARLGERQALQWFRLVLNSEDSQRVHEAIQLAAAEGVYFLWAELDQLADSPDLDIAHHASEALERLREELNTPPA